MRALARELVLLAAAAALSWWLALAPPAPGAPVPDARRETALPVALTPTVRRAAPPAEPSSALARREPPEPAAPEPAAPELPAEPEALAAAEPREEPAAEEPPPEERPAPELGTPEGAPDAEPSAAEVAQAEPAAAEEAPAPLAEPPAAPETESPAPSGDAPAAGALLMRDAELLETAREEFTGSASRGFATVLLASPEEQLAIAEYFGEELVLVPKRLLDPDARDPRWFRVALDGEPRVEAVAGHPPLEGFRQYRDLFDYEYARLPEPLRDLRRSVLSRSEVYLFAALIPLGEWALVVGRRNEALRRAGRDLSEVRRFVIRYVRASGGAFDVSVEEIVFADGTRHRPGRDGREGV